MLRIFLTATVALSLPGLASDAAAAPGDLDTTFSEDGKVLTDFRGRHDEALDVARQGDGKLVAVGGAGGNFAVARYNVDGSLDRSFDGNGRKMTDFGSAFDRGAAVAIQPDGKIVVAGEGGGKVALARYRPNGLLDRTFSSDGKQTTDFGDGDEAANDLNLAASGKIVVAGEGSNAHGGTVALARYLPDGTLDPSFSGDGKQMTGEPGDDWVSIDYEAKAVRLMGSGRIVVAGSATYSDICCQSSEFLLLRYRPDGELDSSFGQDGRVSTRFHAGGDDSGAFDIARQADGRLVVVGWTQPIDWDSDFPEPAGPARFAVARYRADGSPDTTFSRDGKQTTRFGGANSEGNALALQRDGRIVVGGRAAPNNFALARYRPNGDLDASFSGDGKTLTSFGPLASPDLGAGAHSIVLQRHKIVAAGFAVGVGDRDGEMSRFALARYSGG